MTAAGQRGVICDYAIACLASMEESAKEKGRSTRSAFPRGLARRSPMARCREPTEHGSVGSFAQQLRFKLLPTVPRTDKRPVGLWCLLRGM